MTKIKNILIFVIIAGAIFSAYFIFIKPGSQDEASLVESGPLPEINTDSFGVSAETPLNVPQAAGDFLTLLLNVRNIKLEAAILSDPAFQSLKDSSIVLVPDGTEGRPNPFAPIGADRAEPKLGNEQSNPTVGSGEELDLELDQGLEQELQSELDFSPDYDL